VPKSRDEMLKAIDNRTLKHRFAGSLLTIPGVGDVVRVVRGQDIGAEFEVIAVRGNVFSAEQHVYVLSDHDLPTWYHPWDLLVVRRKDD
jgi:hypothetical protein